MDEMKRKLGIRPALVGLGFVAVMVATTSAADACGFVRGRSVCFAPCPRQVVIIDRSNHFFLRSFPSRRAFVIDRRSAFQPSPVLTGRFAPPTTGKLASRIASPPPMFVR